MLNPLGDYIVVKRIDEEMVTKGGLIVTQGSSSADKGEVLAVGVGAYSQTGKLIPMQVKQGDTVLYPAYAGVKVTHDGDNLVVLRESEVIGRV